MEKFIKRFADEFGIISGICDAEDIVPKEDYRHKRIPFIRKDVQSRLSPREVIENPKSIIMLAMPYNKKNTYEKDDEIRGNLSVGAVGMDYHMILQEYFKALGEEIKKHRDLQYEIGVDTGLLMEREFAKKAGIGWQGLNCNIITEDYGSFVYLGYMVTDLKLTPSTPYLNSETKCGGCNRCVISCPGGALDGQFHVRWEKCISYLTQKKGMLSEEEMGSMGNALYGCDICQIVCPYNHNTYVDEISKIEAKAPELSMFLDLSDEAFLGLYGETSMFWRGKNTLLRNGIIAVGNCGDQRGTKLIEKFIDSPDEIIRNTALWAMNRLKFK